MNIVAYVHGYPPDHNAGAEWMLHETLAWLSHTPDHTCTVLNRVHADPDAPAGEFIDGILALRRPTDEDAENVVANSDVVLTHLDLTSDALRYATRHGKPCVHFVHNGWQLKAHKIRRAPLVVYNSEHLAWDDPYRERQSAWTVLHPPVLRPAEILPRDRPRHFITQLNVNRDKGSRVFNDLARIEKRRRFLAVEGAYGRQEIEPRPNVTVMPQQAGPLEAFRETRVVLMPSSYESYGRVAVEAAWQGIPTIYNPTRGLLEGIGPAGLRRPLTPVRGWVEALRLLDDPDELEIRGVHAYDRAVFLADRSEAELRALEQALAMAVVHGP